MIIEQIDTGEITTFNNVLSSLTLTLNKRNVSIIITALSKYNAVIIIKVNGRKGSAERIFSLNYDTLNAEWICLSNGHRYTLLSITELTNILKSTINKLRTILTKI